MLRRMSVRNGRTGSTWNSSMVRTSGVRSLRAASAFESAQTCFSNE